MKPVTVSLELLMLVVPTLTMLYLVFCNRLWLWKKKKTIFHVLLVTLTVASLSAIVVNRYQIRSKAQRIVDQRAHEEHQRALQVQLEERHRAQETHRAQNKLARETGLQLLPGELPECEDPKQVNFPGEWWYLYQSLKECNYWEAKLLGIESFSSHYAPQDIEPLPMAGFDLVLNELKVKGGEKQTWKHIYRARAALSPYLAPFAVRPDCFVAPLEKLTPEILSCEKLLGQIREKLNQEDG